MGSFGVRKGKGRRPGVGSRRRGRRLMGCAGRGKGTTVGDGGGGLARRTEWRCGLRHLSMMSTGGRRQARSLTGPAGIRMGTAVGNGGDGLVLSKGRRPGVGSDRRVSSLMGCAGREKRTTVGDGGDGLARRKGRRCGLRHLEMMSTGGRRQARSSMGPAGIRRGTAVWNGGDGLVMSKGRRPGLRRPEKAAASVCAQEKGRWAPGSGGSCCRRNHCRAICQGGGGGEVEGRVVAAAVILDVREVRSPHRMEPQLSWSAIWEGVCRREHVRLERKLLGRVG